MDELRFLKTKCSELETRTSQLYEENGRLRGLNEKNEQMICNLRISNETNIDKDNETKKLTASLKKQHEDNEILGKRNSELMQENEQLRTRIQDLEALD